MSWRDYPARVVAGLTVLTGLAGAIAIPVADLDTASVVGVVGGLGTVAVAAAKFLEGQRSWEAEQETTRREVAIAEVEATRPLLDPPVWSTKLEAPLRVEVPDLDAMTEQVAERLAERLRGGPQ